MNKATPPTPGLMVGYWLIFMALAIWLMVIIGGATRLTGSGLSITEWKPIMGTLPPLSQEHWQEAFEKYQMTPQFRISNPEMDLHGFKVIFWWEYIHRLWGRLLGVFFAIPLVYFLWKGELARPWLIKLSTALVLGGAQGFLGWFMVMSGLQDKPWVSPYRLTAHLLLALSLFAYVLWLACDILCDKKSNDRNPDYREKKGRAGVLLAWGPPLMTGLLGVQIAWGGFMAGGKLAMSYPSFPTLNGQWLPASVFQYQSLWHHLCEHPAAVHLIHRGLGTLLVLVLFGFWWRTGGLRWKGPLATARWLVPVLVSVQFLLGVATVLLSQGSIPVFLGVAHQATAVLLLAAVIVLWHQCRYLVRAQTTL